MLTIPEINCIKLMRNQKSLSINHISKTLGINWRTAKKYADEDQLPVERERKKTEGLIKEYFLLYKRWISRGPIGPSRTLLKSGVTEELKGLTIKSKY